MKGNMCTRAYVVPPQALRALLLYNTRKCPLAQLAVGRPPRNRWLRRRSHSRRDRRTCLHIRRVRLQITTNLYKYSAIQCVVSVTKKTVLDSFGLNMNTQNGPSNCAQRCTLFDCLQDRWL